MLQLRTLRSESISPALLLVGAPRALLRLLLGRV